MRAPSLQPENPWAEPKENTHLPTATLKIPSLLWLLSNQPCPWLAESWYTWDTLLKGHISLLPSKPPPWRELTFLWAPTAWGSSGKTACADGAGQGHSPHCLLIGVGVFLSWTELEVAQTQCEASPCSASLGGMAGKKKRDLSSRISYLDTFHLKELDPLT